MELPNNLKLAVESLSLLPGIGVKTATRLAMSMTSWDSQSVNAFGNNIKKLNDLQKCQECGLFADGAKCEICLNPLRQNSTVMCVVENITDCLAIEKSEQFKGLYHVLGGVLNPLLGVGPDELKLDQFFNRLRNLEIKEIILAINPSVEGDATCSYLKSQISEQIIVNRIGFGIPIGGNLEYLDPLTISKALENTRLL